ncbi:MAG TPA: sortase, partial [Rubrobacter sp.]|nr:sortase [Rubrobacter sp.]
VTTAVVFVGLGLMGYGLFVAGEPASADTPPDRAPAKAPAKVIGSDAPLKARLAALAEATAEATKDVVKKIQGPKAEAPKNEALKLTVPDMRRVDGLPVYNVAPRGYEKALHDGAAHVKGTGMPWQREANVYIAGHRIGYPGTKSHLVFWDLHKLANGDEVILTDANGTRYTYEVFKKFEVDPDAVRVLQPVKGKNIVSLQTCTLPDYKERLIVQAELKDVS